MKTMPRERPFGGVVKGGSFDMFEEHKETLPYYHPQLKNIDHVTKVVAHYLDVAGCFLLRNSFSKPGLYTVSVLHDGGIKHFNVGVRKGRYHLQEKTFSSIEELILYYGLHDVPNIENIRGVRLLHPIVDIGGNWMRVDEDLLINMDRRYSQDARPASRPIDFSHRAPYRKSSDGFLRASPPSSEMHMERRRASSPSPKTSSFNELQRKTSSVSESIPEDNFHHIQDDNLPLPVCTPKQNGSNKGFLAKIRRSKDGKKESKVSRGKVKSDPMAHRPPAALPREASLSCSLPGQSASYAVVRDIEVDRTGDLIDQLRFSDDNDRCQCGLLVEDTDLPLGWSVHRSSDTLTLGRIFFTSPDNDTSWELPEQVYVQLTEAQCKRLRVLKTQGQEYAIRCRSVPNRGYLIGNSQPVRSRGSFESSASSSSDRGSGDSYGDKMEEEVFVP